MIQNNRSNSDFCLWVLARPADMLSALARQVLPDGAGTSFFSSIYDVVAALLSLGTHTPVVLLTRPAMLAKPHLPAILQQFPNLRLIGWLSPGETVHPFIAGRTARPIITVSGPEELAHVIAALTESLAPAPEAEPTAVAGPGLAAALDPDQYRLSDDELDALLGADR